MCYTKLLVDRCDELTKTLTIDKSGLITGVDESMCYYLQDKEFNLVGMPLSDIVERPHKIYFINYDKILPLTERKYFDLNFIVNGSLSQYLRCMLSPEGSGFKLTGYDISEFIEERKNFSALKKGLSHSLRAPVTTSIGLLNLIDMAIAESDPLVPQYMGKMRETLNGLEKILTNIEQTTIKQNLSPSFIDFRKRIPVLVATAFSNTDSDPVTNLEVAQKTDFFHDIKRLEEIFTILGSHISKSDPGTGKGVFIVAFDINCQEQKCTIKVSHNGIRLPESVKANMFQLFSKFGNDDSNDELYLLNHAVSACEGKIDYQSSRAGSIFTIELPNLSGKI